MPKREAFSSFILALSFISLLNYSNANDIGVNYGRLGDNLPSPYESIHILQNMKANRVRLFDADPETLMLLSWTNLYVTITVPNDQITPIASNQKVSDKWVRDNVLAYYPHTKIRYILVGYDVLKNNDTRLWNSLVPAMNMIHRTLKGLSIQNIKVGTPLSLNTIIKFTFPPSIVQFRFQVLPVMLPLLKFLNETSSYLFLNVHPYFAWSANNSNLRLDYSLLENGRTAYKDPGTGLVYRNLLDQMLDSVIFAMRKVEYNDVRILIAETGWPNAGDLDQKGANPYNAAMYNRNLIRKMTANPPPGTPARPNVIIPTFISSLYDENKKDGPGTERHWGMLRPNGSPVYELDLTGERSVQDYLSLPPPPLINQPYKGNLWCVSASGVDDTSLARALESVCNEVSGICDSLSPGEPCHQPVTLIAHANYAFSSYWAKFRDTGASCYFNGLAVQTTIDPSHGSCRFPNVTL